MTHQHEGQCRHDMRFCSDCDKAYCAKCEREWSGVCSLEHYPGYYWWWNAPVTTGGVSTYPSTTTFADTGDDLSHPTVCSHTAGVTT